VASWLHGVAWRISHKLQASLQRRSAREVALVDSQAASPTDELSWREVQRVLDQELNLLPASYGAPLVLCYLEGKTQDEAARELGWPLPTFRGRLERGRERLRARLARRGITLSAALFGGALTHSAASAAVPPTLIVGTVKASLMAAGQKPLEAAVISPQVVALMQGALNAMLMTKMKIATAVLAVVALSGLTTTVLTQWALADAPSTAAVSAGPATRVQEEGGRQALAQPHEKSKVYEAKSQAPADKAPEEVWTLDFRFKDPRQLTINRPGKGKTALWYLLYHVENRTGQPRTALLELELVIDGKAGVRDQVLPAAVEAIAKVEDPTGYMDLKNSASIAAQPIPVSPPADKGFAKAANGVATWDLGNLDCQRFSIFVSGLSNGWIAVEDGKQTIVRRKTLQLNFKRVGDQYQFVPPAEWVYRTHQLKAQEKPKLELNFAMEAQGAALDKLRFTIKDTKAGIIRLEQQRQDWRDQRARLRLQILQLQVLQTGARRTVPHLRQLEYQIAVGDVEDVIYLIDLDLLQKRLKALQGLPQPADQAVPPPVPMTIQGTVTKVDQAGQLVLLDIGADQGLQKGQRLEVFRLRPQPTYLGHLSIVEVQVNRAVARIVGTSRKGIQPGDHVANSLASPH
jgi:hypothetical protein